MVISQLDSVSLSAPTPLSILLILKPVDALLGAHLALIALTTLPSVCQFAL